MKFRTSSTDLAYCKAMSFMAKKLKQFPKSDGYKDASFLSYYAQVNGQTESTNKIGLTPNKPIKSNLSMQTTFHL